MIAACRLVFQSQSVRRRHGDRQQVCGPQQWHLRGSADAESPGSLQDLPLQQRGWLLPRKNACELGTFTLYITQTFYVSDPHQLVQRSTRKLLGVQFKVCHGSLYAVMWLVDEPREFNVLTLPQRCITYLPEKLPSKYGFHSEEYLPIRTGPIIDRATSSIEEATTQRNDRLKLKKRRLDYGAADSVNGPTDFVDSIGDRLDSNI
ncbi:hypothetical protein ANN_19852 [Periplaneta americana]|uniref:Uncharacterized protein n=1 Tax=Periplaneta americana TaxID=6978 RepID=A0ABQ8SBP3_PERAM|nr:hypothetical protein ANN_19852 [Periplaneta americana]